MTVNRNGQRQCEWCGDPMPPSAHGLAKTCSKECRLEHQRDYFKRWNRTPQRRAYQRTYQLRRYHHQKASSADETMIAHLDPRAQREPLLNQNTETA